MSRHQLRKRIRDELRKKDKAEFLIPVVDALRLQLIGEFDQHANAITSFMAAIPTQELTKSQQLTLFSNRIRDFLHPKYILQLVEILQRSLEQPIKKMPNELENINDHRTMCLCGQDVQKENLISCVLCSTCLRKFHKTCVQYKNQTEEFSCLVCFLKNMDPMSRVKQCIGLGIFTGKGGQKQIPFQARIRTIRSNGWSVEMRSVRVNTMADPYPSFPDSCQVLINNLSVAAFKPLLKTKKPNKRRDLPKEISLSNLQSQNKLRILHVATNETDFQVKNSTHLVGVYVVESLNEQQVKESLLKNIKPIRFSYRHNRKYLNTYEDQCLTESFEVSMICPISFKPIIIPVRGLYCKHVGCMDLSSLIWANMKDRRWKCAICNRNCHELIIDPLFNNIINEISPVQIETIKFLSKKSEYRVFALPFSEQPNENQISEVPTRKIVRENVKEEDGQNRSRENTVRDPTGNPPYVIELVDLKEECIYPERQEPQVQAPVVVKPRRTKQVARKSAPECRIPRKCRLPLERDQSDQSAAENDQIDQFERQSPVRPSNCESNITNNLSDYEESADERVKVEVKMQQQENMENSLDELRRSQRFTQARPLSAKEMARLVHIGHRALELQQLPQPPMRQIKGELD